MFFLFNLIVAFVVSLVSAFLHPAIYFIYVLAVILPSIALSVRRLHDIGRSGLWALIGLLPVGVIVLLVLACIEGERGNNTYGPDPKMISSGTYSA